MSRLTEALDQIDRGLLRFNNLNLTLDEEVSKTKNHGLVKILRAASDVEANLGNLPKYSSSVRKLIEAVRDFG